MSVVRSMTVPREETIPWGPNGTEGQVTRQETLRFSVTTPVHPGPLSDRTVVPECTTGPSGLLDKRFHSSE